MKRYQQAKAEGVNIRGLWIQDWSGIIRTSFGQRVFWNWQWNATRYPGQWANVKSTRYPGQWANVKSADVSVLVRCEEIILLNLMLFIFFGTLYIQNNYGKIKICYECLKSPLCSEDHAIPLDLTGYNTKSYTLSSTFLCYNNTVLIPKLISYSRFRQENQGTEAGWREGHCVYEPQS